MASCTSRVMLFSVMINVIYEDATVKMLNDKTCDVREDPISYIPIEYNCKFFGSGLYIFEEGSPSTVWKLTMDRLTDLSFLNIPQGTGLEMIQLAEGSCEQIKAPMNVKIWVAGKPCESSHRIQQQEASSRVTTYQPTSHLPTFSTSTLQPQAVAYKQSAAFIHPSLSDNRRQVPQQVHVNRYMNVKRLSLREIILRKEDLLIALTTFNKL
ncbi:Hypothetical predicted protein [Mytilus galloprovincialis]|uniref:Uncharacterized protein n=1 Tax=Mytilus galloprovincialis TaxID=29158 RepID=A0A8B6BNB7_MYTGA|nr:Hypothetical predicted protein [Mytilus galloprovincialis]